MTQFLQKKLWPFLSKYKYHLLIFSCLMNICVFTYIYFFVPNDYQQGAFAKIMYIHVPSAWVSTIIYSFMAFASFIYIIWRNIVAFYTAKSSAFIGVCFTIITLFTGMLWGKPIWGAWWVWDARLTSVLILLFFYLSYIFLYQTSKDNNYTAISSSILAIIGFINIPIVKFSVDFWNSLHQPSSILRLSGPAIHPSMLIPLVIVIFAFIIFSFAIILIRLENILIQKKIRREYDLRRH